MNLVKMKEYIKIIVALEQNGNLTAYRISEIIGIPRKRVYRILAWLMQGKKRKLVNVNKSRGIAIYSLNKENRDRIEYLLKREI